MDKNTILVIDDEKDYTDKCCELLKLKGYKAIGFYDSEQTNQYLKENAKEVNIALIDMYLDDDREAGLKLIKSININYPWIISIVVTALAEIKNAAKCMEEGAYSYVSKGDNEMLFATIEKAKEKLKDKRVMDNIGDLFDSLKKLREQSEEVLGILGRLLDEEKTLTKEDTDI